MSTSLRSVMDITEQRRALQQRWTSANFRDTVRQRLQRLASVADTSVLPPPLDDEKVTSKKGEKEEVSPLRRRKLGAVPKSPSLLETEVMRAVTEITTAAKHWQQTAAFVTFDVPATASDFIRWIEALVSSSEVNKDVEGAIFELYPAMKTNPDTAMFLKEMILPFRSMLMMHVVLTVLRSLRLVRNNNNNNNQQQQTAKKNTTQEADPKTKHSERRGSSDSESAVTQKRSIFDDDLILSSSVQLHDEQQLDEDHMHQIALASHKHAALHAKGLRDVFFIDSLLPNHTEQLREHIREVKKANSCPTYAIYHLIYLDSTDDTTDAELIGKLEPLASSGLAHAQLDVGLCCLTNKEFEKGANWLERAAKLGHTTAMLELGKYFFAEAMQWHGKDPTSGVLGNSISPAVQLLRTREVKGKQLAIKKNAAEDAKTKKTIVSENRMDDVALLVKEALRWLEELQDAPVWDGDTPRAKAQGQRILQEIDTDAKKRKEFEEARVVIEAMEKNEFRRKWAAIGTIFVVVLSYVLYKWMQYIEKSRNAYNWLEGNDDMFQHQEELTHVPTHRVLG